tara:strand:+ start:511 stop:1671 length:1161 start_codon:yes stop_codon:yes gene_type:complete
MIGKGKKIVLVVNVAWSMFNFRHGVLTRLLKEGYKVTIITAPDEYSNKLRDMGCEVIDLAISAKGTNPFRDITLISDLYGYYRDIAPDFIIHYSIKPNIYGSLAAKLAGIPSIAITTGLGYTFLNDNLIARVARALYRLSFRFPKEVWFLNDDDRQTFLQYRLVSKDKAVLLYGEGVDLKHFQPTSSKAQPNIVDLGMPNPPVRFLLIARMLWDKGIAEYVDAARIVKELYPHAVFQLLGPCGVANPSVIKRDVIAQWEAEGVVEYLGTTEDVRPLIADADCVVLPSYREGIPRTMIESAAMAKPLIVSDVAGCRDVVIPDVTGFLCPVKDVKGLAECYEKLIALHPSARALMGNAGRQFMEKQFDEELVIEQYLTTLKKYGVIHV